LENNSENKPCAVQKIETSQGFSVSYKNLFLYSKYNPSKLIISTIEGLSLLPGTIILCFSPLLGYGLAELEKKLPDNCLIILCEADTDLYNFTKGEGVFDRKGQNVISYNPDNLNKLPLDIYQLTAQKIYKRVIRLDMSAGIQFHRNFYDSLYTASSNSVMTFWKNRITLTKFGRRYSKNLFINLSKLAATKPLSAFFKKQMMRIFLL